MAKRRREINRAEIDKRSKEGRGQGRGAEYTPWLRIQDVPSNGLVHRVKGWKTKREHHFLSTLECSYFYVLEWAQSVQDIREQYPLLPLAETLALAEACGFRHPADPRTRELIVMTTDFVVTVAKDNREIDHARAIKPSSKLQSKRVLEKLEIERRYWQARNIDWGIVTEREIPQALTQNVKLLHSYLHIEDRLPLTQKELCSIVSVLTPRVIEGTVSLRRAASDCDKQLGFEPGTSLAVAYHLLAQRRWQLDMNTPIEPGRKLVLVNAHALGQGEGGAQ